MLSHQELSDIMQEMNTFSGNEIKDPQKIQAFHNEMMTTLTQGAMFYTCNDSKAQLLQLDTYNRICWLPWDMRNRKSYFQFNEIVRIEAGKKHGFSVIGNKKNLYLQGENKETEDKWFIYLNALLKNFHANDVITSKLSRTGIGFEN